MNVCQCSKFKQTYKSPSLSLKQYSPINTNSQMILTKAGYIQCITIINVVNEQQDLYLIHNDRIQVYSPTHDSIDNVVDGDKCGASKKIPNTLFFHKNHIFRAQVERSQKYSSFQLHMFLKCSYFCHAFQVQFKNVLNFVHVKLNENICFCHLFLH